jgi:Domain of unknown function (DUF4340)
MKIKKEYIILLILIAALSVYLALRKPDRTHYQLPKVPDMAETDISKIEIDKGAGSIVLNKKGSGWEISPQGYSADTAKVKGLLNVLRDLTLTALVSETKDYNRYDLSADNKIRIRAWASNDLKRDLEVGKAAPTYRHTFVRMAGDDRVYHARGNFRGDIDQSVEDLRDKAVLSFDQGEIREISITKGDASLVLNRKEVSRETKTDQGKAAEGGGSDKAETVWENAEGKKADQKSVTNILSDLSNLKCEKYMEGAKEDLKNPIYKIGLKGNKDYQLSIFEKKEKDGKAYPAVSSENGYPFLLSAWRLDKIMKDPEQLLEKPATEEKVQGKPDKPKEG